MVEAINRNTDGNAYDSTNFQIQNRTIEEFNLHLNQDGRHIEQAQTIAPPMPWIGPRIGPAPGIRPYPPVPFAPEMMRPDGDPRFNPCKRAADGSVEDWEGILPKSSVRSRSAGLEPAMLGERLRIA